jgi:hypothetical protein
MKRSDQILIIILLLILGLVLLWFNQPLDYTREEPAVFTAHIHDSQEQLITAMDLGEPECDAWRTSKDTVVRCMWITDHPISIMSCDDGRLIPEHYRMNGNINRYCN